MNEIRLRARLLAAAAGIPLLLAGCAGESAESTEQTEAVASAPAEPTAGESSTPPDAADEGICSHLDFSAVQEVYPKLEGPSTKTRENSGMFDCFLRYPDGYEEQVIAEEGLDETLYTATRTSFGMHFNFTPQDPSDPPRDPVQEWDLADLPGSELVSTPAGRTVLISMRLDGTPGYEGYTQAQYDMVDDEGQIITVYAINFASHGPGAAAVDAAVLEILDGLARSI